MHNISAENEEAIQASNDRFFEAILLMDQEMIIEFLSTYQANTELILNSLELTTTLNFGDAVLVSSIGNLKHAIDGAIMWIENQDLTEKEQDIEVKKTKSTKTQKPQNEKKRIVYGADSLQDESEQL